MFGFSKKETSNKLNNLLAELNVNERKNAPVEVIHIAHEKYEIPANPEYRKLVGEVN